jgi:propionyl-CoA carboxylase alpha chain
MQFEYFVTIDGESFDLKVDADADGATIQIGDNSYQVEGAYRPGAGVQQFQVNGQPMSFRIQQLKDQLVLSRHGREVRTRAMNRREHEFYSLMPEKVAADTSSMVISPMPGKVLSVNVKPGDKLDAGAEVCVLEAMKMENVLYAEKECVVQEILVVAGDTVEADQLLVQLEVNPGQS